MNMRIHRGIILPALFGLLFVLIIAAYGALFFILPIPPVFKVLITLGVGALAAAMVYIILQRYREIQEEGKNDIDKY